MYRKLRLFYNAISESVDAIGGVFVNVSANRFALVDASLNEVV